MTAQEPVDIWKVRIVGGIVLPLAILLAYALVHRVILRGFPGPIADLLVRLVVLTWGFLRHHLQV
jgi:hypothetical protein